MIRAMQDSDGPKVLEIYAFGLKTRNATFETHVPTWEKFLFYTHPPIVERIRMAETFREK